MRAVDASGNRTAPLAVDSDRIRVEASYFSIVPRIVNVVESGGVDWTAAASTTAPRPETTAADNSSTESRFLMTGPWADAMRNEPWPAASKGVPVDIPGLQSDKDLAYSGLHDVADGGLTSMNRHMRHTVAKWCQGMSLSVRLSLFLALVVIGVVAGVAYLEMRSFERDIDRELVEAARLGAQTAADNLAAREQPLDPLDTRDMLHDLVETDPLLDAISVIGTDGAGHVRIVTSTSTEERAEVLDLAGRAITTRAPTTARSNTVVMFALPVPRHGNYAVAATVGLESLLQARAHGLRVALGFAVPTILLVTILVHLTVRRLLGQPLTAILRTMEATAGGDLRARTTTIR